MSSNTVSPLRISKTTPMSSPVKANPFQRALGEIPPTSQRRNSPSYNQTSKKMMFNRESSPFDSSPNAASPRLFWKGRDPLSPGRDDGENAYDPDQTLSPKRSSIENLKKASRVKNSSMFAREQKNEYDPARSPVVERPLAKGRPLSVQVQGNAYDASGLQGLRNQNSNSGLGHRRGESQSKIPLMSGSPTKSPGRLPTTEYTTSMANTPSRDQPSPIKSSLSNGRSSAAASRTYDPESSIWSDDDNTTKIPARPLRRHAKSVTFDTAPPEVNEYEMVTPDPSVASGTREGSYESDEYDMDGSFDRDMHHDQDDSFDASLEDTEKTPVVLPEDWRQMSPDTANASLVDNYDDVFEGRDNSPMPNAKPVAATASHARTGSTASDGEPRPLPPLPFLSASLNSRMGRESLNGFSATAERLNSSTRSLPTPPQAASISKADILSMRDPSMTLEDRLRLMELQSSPDASPDRKPSEKWSELGAQPHEDADTYLAPKISRESILKKVRSRTFENTKIDYDDYAERNYGDLADLDPDVPIPSREASSNFDEHPTERMINESMMDDSIVKDGSDSEVDAYDIPEMYSPERSQSRLEDYGRESSVIRYDANGKPMKDDDETSIYSSQLEEPEKKTSSSGSEDDEGPPTPKAEQPASRLFAEEPFVSEKDFDLQLRGLMAGSHRPEVKASSPLKPPVLEPAPKLEAMREFLQRPTSADSMEPPKTPTEDSLSEEDDVGTPDSVIRHPVVIEPVGRNSPVVPEATATIKAPGGKLKTRPSITPADAAQMAATRRQVSGQMPPPIPDRSPNRASVGPDFASSLDISSLERSESLKKMQLDISISEVGEDLSFDMSKEFDRVVEAQKVGQLFPIPSYATLPAAPRRSGDVPNDFSSRAASGQSFIYQFVPADTYSQTQKGYLMRQNTKVVVASSRQFSDEQPPPSPTRAETKEMPGSATRKPSDRGPTWTTEPWNGKMRRRSTRQASGGHRKAPNGPMPPLPGQESNVAGLGIVNEASMIEETAEEGAERGRLFVKVVGVKDLDLPLPQDERTWFQLTLDNGLHCVTTSWLELGHSAPIGQEFELVVLNDLEFQLTLQTKLEAPPKPTVRASSPLKSIGHKKSQSAFGKFWSSPKKRAEKERKEREEADRLAEQHQHQEELRKKSSQKQTAWDLLHDLVAPDGSFARAYVCLKNHESQAYGRPFTVDVPCFNEWALEDSAMASSVKSKHGGVVRRPPYKVGKLTLQLLFVPKPHGAKDDDLPKSLNACVREMKEAEEIKASTYEGHLSQQGGDCPYWRRRFFRLKGGKLTAYHETTMQPRATINLAKASKLIDDRSSLTQSTSTKSGGRRKSAFSEEEEGYMFVEEGFRIRFANGEVIDFYADSAKDKEGWMKILSQCVGRSGESGSSTRKWCELVLEKERREGKLATQQHQQQQQPTKQDAKKNDVFVSQQAIPASQHPAMFAKSAPNSPVKKNVHREMPPAPLEKSPRHKPSASVTSMKTDFTKPPPRAGAMSPPLSPRKGAMSPLPRAGAMSPQPRNSANPERRKQIRSMLF